MATTRTNQYVPKTSSAQQARDAYQAFKKQGNSYIYAQLTQAKFYAQHNNHETAIAILAPLSTLELRGRTKRDLYFALATSHCKLGYIFYAKGAYAKAKDAFESALAIALVIQERATPNLTLRLSRSGLHLCANKSSAGNNNAFFAKPKTKTFHRKKSLPEMPSKPTPAVTTQEIRQSVAPLPEKAEIPVIVSENKNTPATPITSPTMVSKPTTTNPLLIHIASHFIYNADTGNVCFFADIRRKLCQLTLKNNEDITASQFLGPSPKLPSRL